MNWLKEKLAGLVSGFLTKTFLNKHVKKLLDKLPANGKKTYLGFLILIINAVIVVLGGDNPVANFLIVVRDIVLQNDIHIIVDPVVISTAIGLVTSIIGLYHKALKRFAESKENKE